MSKPLVGERNVELTFDDGPADGHTAAVLDVLAKHAVKATFFVVGQNVVGREHLLERMAAEGHGIGNHSWSHPKLPELNDDGIRRELAQTSEAIEAVVGFRPDVFRPPYGDTDKRVEAVAADLGLRTLLWDIDPRDWSRPGVEAIRDAIAGAEAGQVLLLHDGGGDRSQTVAALGEALKGKR